MSIKARMMLPQNEDEDGELTKEDPRYQLVQRLLQYKRYKEAGSKMRSLSDEQNKIWSTVREFEEGLVSPIAKADPGLLGPKLI